MKNFIITESEKQRILEMHQSATSRQYLKENEDEWIDMSNDMETESDFSMIDLKNDRNFKRLVSFLKRNPDAAMDIKNSLEMNINEAQKYYDYSDDRGKKEITRNQYLKRKLINYGIFGLLGAAIGATMGTMAGEQVLEAALLMAGMGGTVGAELAGQIGRERVKDEPPTDETSIEDDETLSERWSQKYKRSIDCNNPKGFSQKAHCQGRKKR